MEEQPQLMGQEKQLQHEERPIAPRIYHPPALPTAQPADPYGCRDCLAAIAHRMAQPMTALRGGIELGLLGKRTVEEYRTLLQQTLQLADTMSELIISLRDLGEAGTPPGPARHVPLAATAAEVMAEMESLAQARDIRLELHAEESIEACADPERLREALQTLLAWVIQNSAGGDAITVGLSGAQGEARVFLSPPRWDLQYLQVKILEDLPHPGVLFSHAAKTSAMGWAINRRLWHGMGGKLEVVTDGAEVGCIRASLPMAPAS